MSGSEWQWGKRAGSDFDESGPGGSKYENTIDMATDYNGNVYTLARVYGKGSIIPPAKTDVDGHNIPNYGYDEILLTSFTCKGTYRWSKLIGTKSVTDIGVALKTDNRGGVYVTGWSIPYTYAGGDFGPLHIDTDSAIIQNNQGFFLVKYDTSGAYQWVRTPEPDTLKYVYGRSPVVLKSVPVEMVIGQDGEICVLSYLSPGAFANGAYVVTDPGMSYHMLVYNYTGAFVRGYRMDMACPSRNGVFNQGYDNARLAFDAKRNKFYLAGYLQKGFTGEDSLSLGGTMIKNSCFLSRFDDKGNMEWLKLNNSIRSGITGRPVIDKYSNIYLGGSGKPGEVFNGYTFLNTLSPSPTNTNAPFVMKLDSSGKTVWTSNGSNRYALGVYNIILQGNTVGLMGDFVGQITWGSYSFNWSSGASSYIPYLITFNSMTGSVSGADTIACKIDASYLSPSNLAVDRFSNFYAGGGFLTENDMKVGPSTLVSVGGQSDVFIAKYGRDNCDCTIPPTATYTYAKTTGSALAKFTFTGTASSDSVVWYFGDGTEARGNTATHTYASATDNYTACVVVYNRCGSDVYCEQVTGSSGIGESITGTIRVYPNPAQDFVMIDGMRETTQVSLINTLGQLVVNGTTSDQSYSVSLSGLPAGIYLLQLNTASGQHYTTKLIKQ
ncbi:MAG: T9SS type A sorting domain-containing protein [Chitinophagaceae bacterium]